MTGHFLPTIYDSSGNILAYSDYSYSIFTNKNKFSYIERDASTEDIKKILYESDPSIRFEKILTRKYPYREITNNFLGQVDIDHKGISLIEAKLNSLNENIKTSINLQIQQKIFTALKEDSLNLKPDFSLHVFHKILPHLRLRYQLRQHPDAITSTSISTSTLSSGRRYHLSRSSNLIQLCKMILIPCFSCWSIWILDKYGLRKSQEDKETLLHFCILLLKINKV